MMTFDTPAQNDVSALPWIVLTDISLLLLVVFLAYPSERRDDGAVMARFPVGTRTATVLDAGPVVTVYAREMTDGEAAYWVNGRAAGSIRRLPAALREETGGRTDLPVLLAADPETPFQHLAAALERLSAIGFDTVAFARPSDETP